MKRYMYMLSVISAGILAVLFSLRGNYPAAALAVGAIVFYAYGLVQDIRRSRTAGSVGDPDAADDRPDGGAAASAGTDAPSRPGNDVDKVLAELRELLAKYTRYMRVWRNASVTLSLIAAMLAFVNESLAIAILVIALFALFKFWQNLRAVRMIRKGAGSRLDRPRG